MTLAVTIPCFSLSRSTFDNDELRGPINEIGRPTIAVHH
jgi:hypothetical protein